MFAVDSMGLVVLLPELVGEDMGLATNHKDCFEALPQHACGHLAVHLLTVPHSTQLPHILRMRTHARASINRLHDRLNQSPGTMQSVKPLPARHDALSASWL